MNVVPERTNATAVPLTVVVPCYNEEPVIAHMAGAVREARMKLGPFYDIFFIFVDDASTDATMELLRREFEGDPRATILAHHINRGIAAAIRTGIEAARTELVASIDCDCTYDPREIGSITSLLTDDVDLVTASPYHPLGAVEGVPPWRLFLSRTLSRLYRLVLTNRLSTYTSCFRVYRRSRVLATTVEDEGFLGIAEQLARIDLEGGRIVEYPTTLRSRALGHSKLRIARTIRGHIGLLIHLAGIRTARALHLRPRLAPRAAGS